MTGNEQILLHVDEAIAVITLNRPEQGNAFTQIMRRDLVEALARSDADDDVRAVVLTGAGRHFCVGADLAGNDPTRPFAYQGAGQSDLASIPETISGVPRDGGGVVTLQIASMRTPVIAAVNGAAVGVGATMTLPCDIRISSESARFGFVFARRGIVPEAASSWFLPRVVGISRSMEWVATGRLVSAVEALQAGLLSRVVPPEEVLPTALEIAREIRDNTSALSLAVARQMLWAGLSEPSPWWAHELESLVMKDLKAGPDAAEGVASFLEKRSPEFPARVSRDYPVAAPHWPARPERLVP